MVYWISGWVLFFIGWVVIVFFRLDVIMIRKIVVVGGEIGEWCFGFGFG